MTTPVSSDTNTPDWVLQLYTLGNYATSASDVFPSVVALRSLLAEGNYIDIEIILYNIKSDLLSCVSLVTILTTLFPARERIGNWLAFVCIVQQKLISEDHDPKKFYAGSFKIINLFCFTF